MIKARIPAENPDALMPSYEETRAQFDWSEAEKAFTWHETGGMNIVHEAVDRWVRDPESALKTALLFEKGGECRSFTYRDLQERSCQWANVLTRYGFETGDRLFVFLPPCPEVYLSLLACARVGVVFCSIYANSTYDELNIRLANARPRGILTHPDLAEMISPESCEALDFVFLLNGPPPRIHPNELLLEGVVNQMPKEFPSIWVSPETPLYLCYTSGSTGPPKGVIHCHKDMVGIRSTARQVLDLREDTILWADADPAWVTGTVYGALAPWLCGATTVVLGDPFQPANWYWALEKHLISVWYTTPRTLVRLREAGNNLASRYDFTHLQHIATVGAPLVPDLFYWAKEHLHRAPHDTYWMTETGMICIANFPSMDIKPGSMGKPVPGVAAAILDEAGEVMPPMSLGELAIKVGWPAMMTGLWEDDERYRAYFREDGWFLTGDMALVDDENYFYHQGRNDELIKVGGDRVIGPFEIEQVLCMHPAVSEAAVIYKGGGPEEGDSSIKAFITVSPEFTPSARLNHEIKAFVKASLSPDVVVKEIVFLDRLPKTRSGKLLRRVLRAGELGLPGGDPSFLEE